MKKKQINRHVVKHVIKCTAVSVLALTMVLQLCFSFTSLAYSNYSDNDYPYWDEPYNGSYSYWYDDRDRKLTNVTRTYDDGTTYTSKYQYNTQGKLISASIKEPDGSKSTMNRTFNGDILVSETVYEYDAGSKSEQTNITEYRESGYPSHELQKYKYADGTSQSKEGWYLEDSNLQKYVEIDTNGITKQTDYTYDAQGRMLTRIMSSTDGSASQEEWQYDGSGEILQYKSYEYDAVSREKDTLEVRMEGDENSRIQYVAEIREFENSGMYKEETWMQAENSHIIKRITTNPDGSQSTENYTYNSDGKETLYTNVSSDGTVEKRETFYTKSGEETVYTDGRGQTKRSSTSYDSKSEMTTEEETVNNADGSYSYTKQVYDSYYNDVFYIRRDREADGSEVYIEKTYRSDGSSTVKEKTADGTTTVTETDTEGDTVGSRKTLADGTNAETTWTRREDGQATTELTRYSDGSEDRIDYEYNESGDLVKETETRRNGVSAVTLMQYNAEDSYMGTQSTTFNNGYQVTYSRESISTDKVQNMFTYSVGDVYQDIVVENGDDSIQLKTIYRDGRTEEAVVNLDTYEDYYAYYEKVEVMNNRYSSFLVQAWSVLPSQTEAAPSEAEQV